MKQYRSVALAVAVVVAFAIQSRIGRSEQAPPGASGAGPFESLHFRPIGPAAMSGRISDLAVYEPNPSIFYVGTAHGGVWKTTNNGTTFEAEFQTQGLMSIGDVAVSQNNPDLVWAGTGESNNRQSTSWGEGIYKSTDGGKTFTHMGLRTSRYISRIVIDPRNTDTVLVAVPGNLWGAGGERGVYKTSDAGRSWTQVLKVDEDTGGNDLVMDPTDSRIVYATTYQRRRTACCMNGGGAGSGIWKSTDGGDTWTRLTEGIPAGPLGRVAIDLSRRRPAILYALIEGPAPAGGRGGTAGEEAPGAGGGRNTISQGVNQTPTGLYRSDDAGATWRKVNNANPRPMYFSQVRVDPNDPDVVFFGGVDLHKTMDGGKTVNTAAASKIHSDHHAIWIDPSNSNHLIIGNDGGLAMTYDQGRTWTFLPNLPVGLFYHVSYDMATPFHVCGGMQDNYSWCGPSAVRGAAGIANFQWMTVQGGDGFVALQDPSDYRTAYSESQDGNMVRIDRITGETITIRPLPGPGEPPLRWNWDTPFVQSPHDPKVLYAAANKVFRSPDRGLSWVSISPDLTSNVNREEIVTMGVQGSDIRISKNDGIQTWPTIISFAESPKRPGLLYAGTDDGNLQVSRDGGKNWTNVISNIPGLPKGIWVSKVLPSRFDEGTVYASFDGHRQNDFDTHIYGSNDYGQTWRPAAGNLNGEVVKTLTEDLKNPDVLYAGAETGLFVSLDRARSWTRIRANLPTVRIDEITLHPRDNAMILATHGRALWILDHLEPIQEYAAARASTTGARLFSLPSSSMYRKPARDRNYEFWGDQTFFGENPPEAAVISWYLPHDVGEVKLKIADAAGREVREIAGPALATSNKAGIQTACWDLRVPPAPPLPSAGGRGTGRGAQAGTGAGAPPAQTQSPFGAGCAAAAGGPGPGFGAALGTGGPYVLGGVYNVSLVVDGKTADTKPLRVVDDPEVVLTSIERKRMFDMAMEMHELQRRATTAAAAHASLAGQLTTLMSTITDRSDIPAETKASIETVDKDLAAIGPKFATPSGRGGGAGGGGTAGGAGGGRGGASESVLARIGQAKAGLMAGIPATEQTMRAYSDSKTQAPKAIADLNAAIAKAASLSSTLSKYNLTLNVPEAIKATEGAAPKRSTSSQR